MNKQFIVFFLLLICCRDYSLAQNVETKGNRIPTRGLYFFSGIGPAIPVGDFGDNREVGLDLNTAISYRFGSDLYLRAILDIAKFNFDRGEIVQVSGNESYDISGRNNLLTFNVSMGYVFVLGRINPYIFTGAGISNLTRPLLEVDEAGNTVDISRDSFNYFSTLSGAGIDILLNRPENIRKQFILYLEAFYTYIPGDINEISPHKFNLATFNIGLKTRM